MACFFRRRLVAGLLSIGIAVVAGACAAATSTDVGDSSPAIVVTDATGAAVTIESVERIIPLDGTVAEVVFALGMGDNVVATDLSATYPAEADALPEIGYQRALSAEPIAALEPTVLLATDIAGPPEALDELRALGYPLVIVPNDATATGPGEKIRAVGAALGVADRADELAAEVDAEIADNTVAADGDSTRPTVLALYVRGASAQLVLGESSSTRWLIEAAGGTDGSRALGVTDTAPITAEAILALAPDLLIVSDSGLESVGGIDGLLAIGGLGRTPAGRSRHVVSFDDQLLLGNGPRSGEVLATLAAAIADGPST